MLISQKVCKWQVSEVKVPVREGENHVYLVSTKQLLFCQFVNFFKNQKNQAFLNSLNGLSCICVKSAVQ